MKQKRLCNILLLLAFAGELYAQSDTIVVPEANDTTLSAHSVNIPLPQLSIYQGMCIKLDLGSSAVVIGVSKGKIQHYELAMNWRLINRLYPTFEAGYAGGTKTQGDTLSFQGQGGFFRVGLDLNPLKKSAASSPHALLIGLRLGTGIQQFTQDITRIEANIADTETGMISNGDYKAHSAGVHADCWGEIVVGCQVQVAKDKRTKNEGGFYMGWMGRFRCLFTRNNGSNAAEALAVPIYIPGFGNRDNIGWGLSYHIGYKF